VAPPLAGAIGTGLPAFLFWDGLGSLLWLGSGIAVGWLFHTEVDRALDYLDTLGFWALVVLGVGLALVIVVKLWQRQRLHRKLRLARISVSELQDLIARGKAPAIVDVRTRTGHLADPRRIPGALCMTVEELDEKLSILPRHREVVLYCT